MFAQVAAFGEASWLCHYVQEIKSKPKRPVDNHYCFSPGISCAGFVGPDHSSAKGCLPARHCGSLRDSPDLDDSFILFYDVGPHLGSGSHGREPDGEQRSPGNIPALQGSHMDVPGFDNSHCERGSLDCC